MAFIKIKLEKQLHYFRVVQTPLRCFNPSFKLKAIKPTNDTENVTITLLVLLW